LTERLPGVVFFLSVAACQEGIQDEISHVTTEPMTAQVRGTLIDNAGRPRASVHQQVIVLAGADGGE